MATFGLYSVLSHEVAARGREIAIRAALGAQRGNLLGLVAARAAGLTLTGIALGLAVAAVASPLLAPFLYRTDPWAPGSFTAAAVILLIVATFAALGPARRATATEPASALRS